MRLILFALAALSFAACTNNQQFNKTAWSERGDLGIYPNREKILNDLMNNHRLKGLTYKQLIDLLGEPEKYKDEEPNTGTYNIVTDYGGDIDPVYVKNLEVKFSTDSIVKNVSINEIKH